jgi:hypothetical protein
MGWQTTITLTRRSKGCHLITDVRDTLVQRSSLARLMNKSYVGDLATDPARFEGDERTYTTLFEDSPR